MIVISDTTPIIALIKIHKLDLLQKLFNEIVIPEAVFKEVVENENFYQEAEIVKKAEYIKIVSVKNLESLKILQKVSGLDDGESEAIILAEEQKFNLLIIDEKKGRNIARKLGITITGTIGLLIQACNEKILSPDEVRKCLNELKKSKIRISDNLIKATLEML